MPFRRASERPLDRSLIDDLVAANRTLARLGVLDAFGHVSMRDPRNPHRYLMSRSIAPESVSASDILVLDLDSQTVDPKDEGKLLYRERFIHGPGRPLAQHADAVRDAAKIGQQRLDAGAGGRALARGEQVAAGIAVALG